jgi:peptidyl-tRNA hydrolase, PTH1 family
MTKHIKAIIGLGNPGPRFVKTRHNIGFMVLNALADKLNALWRHKDNMEITDTVIIGTKVLLIKPQTFMNNSGQIAPFIKKQGIKPEDVLVIHDELEKPFGTISLKFDGSARGHNGLKSLINFLGPDFWRLRCGIGRPENKEEVADYVLSKFSESNVKVEDMIHLALKEIISLYC